MDASRVTASAYLDRIAPAPVGFRYERGLLWPEDDTECAEVIWDSVRDLESVLPLCRGFDVAVQAGGNCGVWALALVKHFDRVICFEPDATNFQCLIQNTAGENVTAFPAALGEKPGWCDLDRRSGNAGAHQVRMGGPIPVMSIDDLFLPACDLIYLDIEGSEPVAIKGAWETIQDFHPVVAFEDKGLSRRFGVKMGQTEKMLEGLGYEVVARPARDVVMAWNA